MGALGLFALARHGLGALWTWLSHRSFWQLVSLALAGLALLLLFQRNDARHDAAKWQKQYTAEHTARLTDRATYQKAQADAKARNQADIQKTEQRQKEISDARVSDLNARLERIARELRDNPAAKGSAGRAPLPKTGDTPCRAYDPAWLCLSPADRLRAAQNEERHDQLITWNQQQVKVDPNTEAQP
jgi:hypothetical protein